MCLLIGCFGLFAGLGCDFRCLDLLDLLGLGFDVLQCFVSLWILSLCVVLAELHCLLP